MHGDFLHRYRKDVDGFLKVNMVRFETVEVTKEIMKNMAKKPQSLRKSQRTSSRNKRAEITPESSRSSPAGSSSPSSSSSSSYSSELSGCEDVSSQPSPRGSDSPVYCVMSTIPHIEEEPGGLSQEDCDVSGTSGAVQALTEVARGLGMDVVWFLHDALHHASIAGSHVALMRLNWFACCSVFCCGAVINWSLLLVSSVVGVVLRWDHFTGFRDHANILAVLMLHRSFVTCLVTETACKIFLQQSQRLDMGFF